jgi:hypothetical protein
MYFNYQGSPGALAGGHNVLGARAAAMTWNFAEGFTGPGFDEYLTIMNPGAAGTAALTYFIEGQTTPTTRNVPLNANSRTTVVVHDGQSTGNPGGLGRLQVGHSTRVVSTVPVVVERPMYFDYMGSAGSIPGGHNVLGATATATAWSFAEGFTNAGFDEYLTIQNPGAAGTATLTYFIEGQSSPTTRSVPLNANSRTTVSVHNAAGGGNPGGLGRLQVGHSTLVESTVPIVVERPMYFNYVGSFSARDGHNELGFPGTASLTDDYETAVMADNPASYWRFGEASGTSAADEVGGRTGTYMGTYTLGQPGALAGVANTAAAFDNFGHANFGDVYDFGGNAGFTLEAWVYPTAVQPTAFRRVISKEANGTGRFGYALGYMDGASAPTDVFCGRYNMATVEEASGSVAMPLNTWHHLVCTYDGTTIRVYLNGTLVDDAVSSLSLPNTTANLNVAQLSTGGSYVTGRIDEVAIYTTVLSPTRVAAHRSAAQ